MTTLVLLAALLQNPYDIQEKTVPPPAPTPPRVGCLCGCEREGCPCNRQPGQAGACIVPALEDIAIEWHEAAITEARAARSANQKTLIVYSQDGKTCPACERDIKTNGDGNAAILLTRFYQGHSTIPAWVTAFPTYYSVERNEMASGYRTMEQLERWLGVSGEKLLTSAPPIFAADITGKEKIDNGLKMFAEYAGDNGSSSRTVPADINRKIGAATLLIPKANTFAWDFRGASKSLRFTQGKPRIRVFVADVYLAGVVYSGDQVTLEIDGWPDWKVKVK